MRLLRQGMWVLACTAVAGAGPALAELELTRSLEVSETYSDNVDQAPKGDEESGFLTDVTPVLDLRYQAPRVSAAFDSATTVRYQVGGQEEGFELLPHLTGFSTVEVSKELFFVDASAAISRQLLNTRQRDIQANRDTLQTYLVSPYLVERFGGFASGELRYTYSQILGGGGDDDDDSATGGLSDSMGHAVSGLLNSGPDFTRFLWSFNAIASEQQRTDDDDVIRREVILDTEYVVARPFSLLASAGYEQFDDGVPGNEIDGPTWRAGFEWRPGPGSSLSLTYGRSDGDESFEGLLTYQVGPRTTLHASYIERLTTGGERLTRDLSFIGLDLGTNELISTRTGLPFDPNTAATSLADRTERIRTFTLAGRTTRGRNSFLLSGAVEHSEPEDETIPEAEEMAYRLLGSWGRQLSRYNSLDVFGIYARHEFELEDRTDDLVAAGGTFSSVVYRNVHGFATYVFSHQSSTDEEQEFIENRVTVGLRMVF